MGSRRGRSYSFFIIIILLALGFGFLSYSLFWTGNAENREANSISNVIGKILTAQKNNQNVELNSADINGILSGVVKEGIEKDSITINSVYCSIKDDEIKVYSPVTFKGFDFLLSSGGKLGYENDVIVFIPSSFYIGKLPLPKKIVMSNISKYNNNNLRVNDDRFEISKNILPFSVKSIEVKNDVILVGLNKITDLSGSTIGNTGGGTALGSEKAAKLLKDAKGQLSRVYEAVKSNKAKDIVSNIENVVNKMIENAKYSYSKDAKNIRDKYNSLSIEEKIELGKAIISNMSSEVIEFIRSTFGV